MYMRHVYMFLGDKTVHVQSSRIGTPTFQEHWENVTPCLNQKFVCNDIVNSFLTLCYLLNPGWWILAWYTGNIYRMEGWSRMYPLSTRIHRSSIFTHKIGRGIPQNVLGLNAGVNLEQTIVKPSRTSLVQHGTCPQIQRTPARLLDNLALVVVHNVPLQRS